VLTHWLERGADGFRLDAAYAVPTQFWAKVLTPVRAAHPEAYFLGEVIHGDYGAFVEKSTMDSVTQYELWKAIWSALESRNFFELSWTLERHNQALATFVPQTFLSNHDVTRIASKLTDDRDVQLALALLCTLGGTPSIYYGDEQEFRGVKEIRAGGDDAVRPQFPDKPDELAPYGWPTYRLHQELIGLRRRHPWLHEARSSVRHLSNLQLSLDISVGSNHLLLALNLADEPADVPTPAATAVLSGKGRLTGSGESAQVRLAAHSYTVLDG
jgi:cyclomaltodextrinase